MILVRNCPHNNGIHTLLDDAEDVVIKSSYTTDGIDRLSREYAGYLWYFEQKDMLNGVRLQLVENNKRSYSRLYIKLFSGYAGKFYKNIAYNREYLLMAINAYENVWPRSKEKLSPLHGDFSLGNLIFNENSLTIIDWEHFQPSGAPWGFDLVNLLYESALFSFKGRNTLKDSDCKVFIEIRKAISKLLNIEEGFKCILDDLTEFISTNVSIWGDLVNKLPVMKFSTAQHDFLVMLEKDT